MNSVSYRIWALLISSWLVTLLLIWHSGHWSNSRVETFMLSARCSFDTNLFCIRDINVTARFCWSKRTTGSGLSCCQVRTVYLQQRHSKISSKTFFYMFYFVLFLCFSLIWSSSQKISTLGLILDVRHPEKTTVAPVLGQLYARNMTAKDSPFQWVVKGNAVPFFQSFCSPQTPHTAPAGKKSGWLDMWVVALYIKYSGLVHTV